MPAVETVRGRLAHLYRLKDDLHRNQFPKDGGIDMFLVGHLPHYQINFDTFIDFVDSIKRLLNAPS
jgi:hypothetical protein